jgi:hypothetical protein
MGLQRYGGGKRMVRVQIRLNGAKIAVGLPEEGLASIEVTDTGTPPVFVVVDEDGGKAETFYLVYQDGRWTLADYGSLTDQQGEEQTLK